MGGLRVLASRLLSVLRKPRLDEDPDVELGSHLQLLIEEKVRRGMQYPADDAGWAIRIAPLQHEIVADAQLGLVVLLGAVAVVLLETQTLVESTCGVEV